MLQLSLAVKEVLESIKISHCLRNGLVVCLYGLALSFSHELAFGVELSPGVMPLQYSIRLSLTILGFLLLFSFLS